MNPLSTTARRLPYHEESTICVHASPANAFAFLDDPLNLSAHMESSSPMMAGGSMHVEMDALHGRAVGSRIRLTGRILGVVLEVDEVVVQREVPTCKVWETLGTPLLLVIGVYRMGFEVEPVDGGSRVRLWIDYDLPRDRVGRWMGRMFGRTYARWCTDRMLRHVGRHFSSHTTGA